MWQPHGSAFRLLTHFIQRLQLLESLPYLPANAILLTADVISLYTNIPDKEGIETVLHYIKLHANALPPGALSHHTNIILLETILKNNNLSFMGRHFLQLFVTAIGAKAAHHTPTFSSVARKKPSGKPSFRPSPSKRDS